MYSSSLNWIKISLILCLKSSSYILSIYLKYFDDNSDDFNIRGSKVRAFVWKLLMLQMKRTWNLRMLSLKDYSWPPSILKYLLSWSDEPVKKLYRDTRLKSSSLVEAVYTWFKIVYIILSDYWSSTYFRLYLL